MPKDQLIKVGKGALIAIGGALLTYISAEVLPLLEDSGNGVLLAVSAAASVLINSARKWIDTKRVKPPASLLLVGLLCHSASAQTAIYNGRAYTPESYPRGVNYSYPNCRMCNNIRSQWSAQGWISGSGAKKQMATPKVVAKSVASKPKVVEPAEYKLETRTRTVTKYRTEPYTTRQCVRDRWGRSTCRMVTLTRQVPYQATETYQVKVPIEKPKPKPVKEATSDISDEPDGTPQTVIDSVLSKMDLSPSDTLWDIGSGRDARVLVTASERYGCRGFGVEINEKHAEASRKVIQSKGLSGLITIVTADALDFSYENARKVFCYQYPDLQEEILQRLQPGTLVGCYSHRPESLETRRYSVLGHEFFVGYLPTTRRTLAIDTDSLFGLEEVSETPTLTSQPITFGL